MNIVFDGRWLGRTGIGRYAQELLDQLQAQDQNNHYQVLLLPEFFATWKPTNPNFRAVLTTHEVYTWQEQLLLPRQIRQLKPDLVHFTSFNLPIFYRGKFVVTIHDLILLQFKNARGEGAKKLAYELKYLVMKLVLRSAVKRARTIIVPVKYVRNELLKRYPKAENKIVVTYEAAHPTPAQPEPIDQFNVGNQFIMYVGTYFVHKNIGRLVEAFAHTNARAQGTKLVLCGQADYFQNLIRKRVEELGLSDVVVFTGRVTDGQLVSLYQKATLYVFPSLSEGFGLPGLEAMTFGTPVLAARASCLPEVYGDAAAYFDPLSISDMASRIDEVINDGAQRQQLVAAGKLRVTQFSWAKMAAETLAIYENRA